MSNTDTVVKRTASESSSSSSTAASTTMLEVEEESLRKSLSASTVALSSDLSKPLTAVLSGAGTRHPILQPPRPLHAASTAANTSTGACTRTGSSPKNNVNHHLRNRSCHQKLRQTLSLSPLHSVKHPCRIGILLHNTDMYDSATVVMDHCISFCHLTTLCLLHHPPPQHQETQHQQQGHEKTDSNDTEEREQACRAWLQTATGYVTPPQLPLYYGETGLTQMLADPNLDAVYVMVPTEEHEKAVLQCLRAAKHVLIKDFRSTALQTFREQVAQARAVQRFVQFSTMFDIQYNVQTFLDTVLQVPTFGRIERITAELEIGPPDLSKVGVSRPLAANDSCIHRLARYCVLMGLLLTPAEQSRPLRAQIEWCLRSSVATTNRTTAADNDDTPKNANGSAGVPIAAKGQVWFDNGRLLQLQVSYSAVRTHQRLQVHAATKYAVLGHFCLPAEHGLHSFRVYDCHYVRDTNTGKLDADVTAGEALDVQSGLPQHVMMWRGFAELCQAVEEQGWEEATQATFFTHTAIALKATLKALETSAAEKNRVVDVVLE
mmetsp:Transcript_5687/g.11601  ORF Transcript_5687/g.11601 Transcript_5687/m.11601 type:complete len:548 (+) Transcript_5687:282-1925(+)